ncbi:unnamed protein product [Phytophthora fragariaefolia]|uniref:Unnamed protein product n=1 Tax=Phytophthora fragariaefolia TaxID=1490495 RepID=A0A9W6XNJ4_9STRA|nr:unnamed protein product [Phytophthora fragariaefolia]
MQFVDIDGPLFSHNLKEGEYEQVFRAIVQLVPEVGGIPEPIFKVVGEEFKDVFPEQLPYELPPMREDNFEVTLRKGAKPSSGVLFRLSKIMTVIAKIPLPLIEELFDQMVGCIVYTLIDLAQGYHQMIVVKSSRPYTAFRTHKETYQWCVAPMGVAGMPGIWSRLMHKLFDKIQIVVVYLDDIFLKSMEEHVEHLRAVCLVEFVCTLGKVFVWSVTSGFPWTRCIASRGNSGPTKDGSDSQQVNTVDYHFVSPHLAPETKRTFQKGYEEDPAFKQQSLEGAQKEKFVKHDGLMVFK